MRSYACINDPKHVRLRTLWPAEFPMIVEFSVSSAASVHRRAESLSIVISVTRLWPE